MHQEADLTHLPGTRRGQLTRKVLFGFQAPLAVYIWGPIAKPNNRNKANGSDGRLKDWVAIDGPSCQAKQNDCEEYLDCCADRPR